ncbi:M14-type cytosolic carboxypeptidase [Luteithermobacter gelatinilyticus]|uniref:M14-type cytosolic carboxypeptidase n=1 Tax=Luteithermobacter gelatinilyticus TaxID=2582913 RepID=UPI00143D9E6B|nr:M14-type cytosolic carboxypeptidase [Luteithermobacter gelatinilyticus]
MKRSGIVTKPSFVRAVVMRGLGGIILYAAAALSAPAAPLEGCAFGDIAFHADFPGARLSACEKTAMGYRLLIRPEVKPVNPSPWYAFRIDSATSQTITVTLDYAAGKHRYRPKVSRDGQNWRRLPDKDVSVRHDGRQVTMTLDLDQAPLWVAAQELLTNRHYMLWQEKLVEKPDLELSRLGRSSEGREIFKLENRPDKDDAQTILLIGRQHPPEVTGAQAMLAFTETVFGDSTLAREFRQNFRIVAVPNLNPDGVASGHWRSNARGKDLNRDWGPFTQPETQLVKAELDRLAAEEGGQLALVLDFHSTWDSLLYVQAAEDKTRPEDFARQWHHAIRKRLPDQPLALEPRKQTGKPTLKNYVYSRFGVPAITYEVADTADRAGLRRQAVVAAEEMMKLMLAARKAGQTGPRKPATARPVDLLIRGGRIYAGEGGAPEKGVIVVHEGQVIYRGPTLPEGLAPRRIIEAGEKVVAPGFIDPHTHACGDLDQENGKANLNYLTQGVTTVFCGNDGGGPVNVGERLAFYESQGIGTNVALYVGHGSVRRAVMGTENRTATPAELDRMEKLVARAMGEGALGLSTGLYYVPGNYATTEEVVALARVAGQYGGVYDSHIRDESSYNIGLVAAIREVIEVGRAAGLPVHIAHLKALGADVWGKSREIITMVEQARADGLRVTADQYPWTASGTSIAGALIPRWVMAGSTEKYHERLRDPALAERIRAEMTDNLRRRGGAHSLLITDPRRPDLRGRTLAEIAAQQGKDPVSVALDIVLSGNARVASFNMTAEDIRRFMVQPWVMTSSDGSTGHPRKYASFPKKYATYVADEHLLSLPDFIYRSSGFAAETFGLRDRGYLAPGYAADIVIFDPDRFRPKADYLAPEKLSEGVEWLLVNGQVVIDKGRYTGMLAGKALKKQQ